MLIVEQIRKDQIESRKARKAFETGVLTTLLGETEKVGKDAGNRQTKDTEAAKVIKKFIKNIDEFLGMTGANADGLLMEKKLLEKYLPNQLSDEELKTIITEIIDSTDGDILLGHIMRDLKAKHDGLYDGKIASGIARDLL